MNSLIDQITKSEDVYLKDFTYKNYLTSNKIYDNINNFTEYKASDTVVTKFEEIAAKFPSKIAVCDAKEKLTYLQLNQLANKIAIYLTNNLKSIDKVIVSLNNNNYLIAVILGILKSGKTYVPIDLNSPQNRINYIINDLDNSAIVAEDSILNTLDNNNNLISISINVLLNDIKDLDYQNLNLKFSNLCGCYMIYTSGSTGNPKGVIINHKNLLSLLHATNQEFKFTENDSCILCHSYGFDFSVWEIFSTILSGAELHVIDSLICKSFDDFYNYVSENNITILNQTPAAFRNFIDSDLKNNKPLNIRYIFLGGEKLYFKFLNDWIKKHSLDKVKIINLYGVTEAAIMTTYHVITENDVYHNDTSTIGIPFSNSEVYIVDSKMNILPQGIPGELLICGDAVADGYYNRAELTKEKFLQGNKILSSNFRIYRSGDLCKLNKDNEIEYFHRLDKQVKLRGYRIELGEIENVILKQTNQHACVVDVISFGENDDRLVAYIVPSNADFSTKYVREKIKNKLPNYMIPSIIQRVDTIPMTINGKIDYTKLKSKLDLTSNKIKEGTELELKLFKIISSIAKTTNFTLTDNFFDIGINSMHIAAITKAINSELNLNNVKIIDLFQYTSIKSLAAFIEENHSKESASEDSSYNDDSFDTLFGSDDEDSYRENMRKNLLNN